MTDLVIGRTVDEVISTLDDFTEMVTSRGTVAGDEDVLGDGIAFAGVAKYPARVKCALLGWMAFKDATAQAVGAQHPLRRRSPKAPPEGNDRDDRRFTGPGGTRCRRARRGGAGSNARRRGCGRRSSLDDLEEALKDVVDPELGVNIVDLGLVYDLQVGQDNVATIDMTLTSAACPLTDLIEDQIAGALTGPGRARRGLRHQLGVAAAVGPLADHRGRPRAAAGAGLQRLSHPAWCGRGSTSDVVGIGARCRAGAPRHCYRRGE